MKLILLMIILTLYSASALAKRVVFIHSYHLHYPWVEQYSSGFLSTIDDITLFEYEMDTKRKHQHDFLNIADNAWLFIQQHQPDLVVLADDNALKMLGPRLLNKNIPIVFLGINANPRNYLSLRANISGVLERPLMKRSVAMLKQIDPKYRRVKVLMSNSVSSRVILNTSFSNKNRQKIMGIDVTSSMLDTFQAWKKEVSISKKEGYQAIILATYGALKDNKQQHVPLNTVSEWTSKHSPIPVFAFWSFSVGKNKAIGGFLISGRQQGIEAAKKVNYFFKTGNMPHISTPTQGTLMFSQHELDRWKITLPKQISDQALLQQ